VFLSARDTAFATFDGDVDDDDLPDSFGVLRPYEIMRRRNANLRDVMAVEATFRHGQVTGPALIYRYSLSCPPSKQ
jgi:hypothetical protein